MTYQPHILERGASTELTTQDGHKWIVFEETGYARIDPVPSFEDTVTMQLDAGDGYVEGYRKKFDSKMRRSKKRAKYLRSKMKGSKVLDVGSNVGCFVATSHALGLDAQGIEINPVLVTEAKRLFPECKFSDIALEDYQASGEVFDGIYCSEVIEHVPDPFGFAVKLFNLLDKNGVLFLTTPSVDEYATAGDVHRHMGAPDHKLYFNKTNIIEFMLAAGFSKVKHRFALGKGLQVICYK